MLPLLTLSVAGAVISLTYLPLFAGTLACFCPFVAIFFARWSDDVDVVTLTCEDVVNDVVRML